MPASHLDVSPVTSRRSRPGTPARTSRDAAARAAAHTATADSEAMRACMLALVDSVGPRAQAVRSRRNIVSHSAVVVDIWSNWLAVALNPVP